LLPRTAFFLPLILVVIILSPHVVIRLIVFPLINEVVFEFVATAVHLAPTWVVRLGDRDRLVIGQRLKILCHGSHGVFACEAYGTRAAGFDRTLVSLARLD